LSDNYANSCLSLLFSTQSWHRILRLQDVAIKSCNPDDAIVIEVYDVPDDEVSLLDHYESGYERVKVNVALDNENRLEPWMYEWTDVDAVKECELIACGDWVKQYNR